MKQRHKRKNKDQPGFDPEASDQEADDQQPWSS